MSQYENKNKIQIVENGVEEFHAGRKAPRDIVSIASECGFKPYIIQRKFAKKWYLVPFYNIIWLINSILCVIKFPRHITLLIQYPNKLFLGRLSCFFLWGVWKFRKAHIITIIHDIDELRSGYPVNIVKPGEMLQRIIDISEIMIVHNNVMCDWLVNCGCDRRKLVELNLFDYILDKPVKRELKRTGKKIVAIAGNFDENKTGYLTELNQLREVTWHLYGINFNEKRIGGVNILYKGCYSPEELPYIIEANFGLVWDGNSIESCSGATGEYLRYNNPHKLSLYIASGLPVIVWNKAAVAKIVEREKLGFSVGSLDEIGKRISTITDEEYFSYVKNISRLSEKIIKGDFTKSAIKKAEEILSK